MWRRNRKKKGVAKGLLGDNAILPHPYCFRSVKTDGLQQFVELSLEVAFGDGTYVLAYEFATLEEEDCRDVAYAILGSNVVVLLYVALAYNNLAVVFLGELRNDRSNHAARTAPCSPKVNYQWQ